MLPQRLVTCQNSSWEIVLINVGNMRVVAMISAVLWWVIYVFNVGISTFFTHHRVLEQHLTRIIAHWDHYQLMCNKYVQINLESAHSASIFRNILYVRMHKTFEIL